MFQQPLFLPTPSPSSVSKSFWTPITILFISSLFFLQTENASAVGLTLKITPRINPTLLSVSSEQTPVLTNGTTTVPGPVEPVWNSTEAFVLDEGEFSNENVSLKFEWNCLLDAETIESAYFSIGTSTTDPTSVLDWQKIDPSLRRLQVRTNFQNGSSYIGCVRIHSKIAGPHRISCSNGITIDSQLPAPPTKLSATIDNDLIHLSWTTGPAPVPSGISGYVIEEREALKPYWKILVPDSDGYSIAPSTKAATPGFCSIPETRVWGRVPGTYIYRVRSVSGSGIISDPSPELRVNYGLDQVDGIAEISNFPNPFDSRADDTRITYLLKYDAPSRVAIYDVLGSLVRENSYDPGSEGGRAGTNLISWDGSDRNGNKVSQGIYYLVVESEKNGSNRKKPLLIGVFH